MHPLKRESSSVGRAQPCQGWGRGFESRLSLNCKDCCSNGGIGRHEGLKIPWLLQLCGFKSRFEYKSSDNYSCQSFFYMFYSTNLGQSGSPAKAGGEHQKDYLCRKNKSYARFSNVTRSSGSVRKVGDLTISPFLLPL